MNESGAQKGGEVTVLRKDLNAYRRFLRLLAQMASKQVERFQQAKTLTIPFFLTDEIVNAIGSEAIDLIHSIAPEGGINFNGTIRFSDLSSLSFDVFSELIAKGGHHKDPQSISLSWSIFDALDERRLIAGSIEIQFVTEKELEGTADSPPGDYNKSYITFGVAGSDREWVQKAYSRILPIIERSRLGEIYRPLWIFRNNWVVQFLSQVFGWIGFFIGINTAERLFSSDKILSQAAILQKILEQTDVSAKIDALARQLLTPATSPWWTPIILMGSGAVTYVFTLLIVMGLLPKLAPSSYIGIGLAKGRSLEHLNTFRFVIFTVIVVGVVVPLFVELIKRLF